MIKTKNIFITCCFLALIPVQAGFCAESTGSTLVDGIIEPSVTVKFGTNSTGIIREVLVDRGDLITKDQVIVVLESGIEAAIVRQTHELLSLAKRKRSRHKELARRDLISKQEIDELETDVRKLEAQLHEARERLRLREIRSTINGVVTERLLYAGEYAGETTPVLQAAAIDRLHVEVVVPIQKYNLIREGMDVRIMPEEPIGGNYPGKVSLVDKVIDAASGTFRARILLPNPDYKIPAGIKCTVQLLDAAAQVDPPASSPR